MNPHDTGHLPAQPPVARPPTPHPAHEPADPPGSPTPLHPFTARRKSAVPFALAALLFATFVVDVSVRTPKAHAAVGDPDREPSLEEVEAKLADARDDADELARLLRQADEALAVAEQDLTDAQRRWADARRRSVAAAEELGRAQTELWRMQEIRGEQARRTYMTKGPTIELTMLLGAETFQDVERALVLLDRAVQSTNRVLTELRAAERRAADALRQVEASERAARREQQAVAAKVRDLSSLREARAHAKAVSDREVSRLTARVASLTPQAVHSTAPPPDGSAEGAVTRTAAGACDLSGASADERWLILHESGGRPTAANPTSSAFGLGQLLHGNRVRYLGKDHDTTDCGKQLLAFRAYVRDSYGDAGSARRFWETNGWY